MKKGKPSVSKLKKKAWALFSKLIRQTYEVNGKNMCCTCGQWKDINEMQAGHFIPGRNNAILFDRRNVHPQCYACNCCKHGNTVEYYIFMLNRYGEEVIQELRRKNNESKQFSTYELETMIADYKEELTKEEV